MPRSSNPDIEAARERIYDAVHGGWADALAAVADLIGADSAITFQPTFQGGQGFGAGWIALNLPDPDIANAHAIASGDIDIWAEALIAQGLYQPGAILLGQEFVSEADWDRHSWRDAVYRPSDIRHLLGCLGSAPDPGQSLITYSFFRGPKRRPFGRRELRTLARLHADLDRAGRLAFRLGQQAPALAERALDALLDPVVIVDPSGRLLFANAAAESAFGLQAFPLSVENGRLSAACGPERLRSALAAAGRGRGSDFALLDAQGVRHDVTVTALPRMSPAAALVAVRAPDRGRQVMIRHGLSPAETEVALLLAQGLSAVDVAAQRQVSVRTVQSQCESIIRKLDVSRQADIIRVVASTMWRSET